MSNSLDEGKYKVDPDTLYYNSSLAGLKVKNGETAEGK